MPFFLKLLLCLIEYKEFADNEYHANDDDDVEIDADTYVDHLKDIGLLRLCYAWFTRSGK